MKINKLSDFSRKKTAVSRKIFPQKLENVTFKKSRIQPKKVEDYANGEGKLTELQKEKLLKKDWQRPDRNEQYYCPQAKILRGEKIAASELTSGANSGKPLY